VNLAYIAIPVNGEGRPAATDQSDGNEADDGPPNRSSPTSPYPNRPESSHFSHDGLTSQPAKSFRVLHANPRSQARSAWAPSRRKSDARDRHERVIQDRGAVPWRLGVLG
jgi:hypothetical protein